MTAHAAQLLAENVAGTLGWLAGTSLADHPEVEQRARWLLLDTLACAAAGFLEREPSSYAARLADQSPGPVVWPGTRHGLSPVAAGTVAPLAACWHEACEGLARAHGRPGLHAVPAAAALGIAQGASLGDVLEAIVWGYEIGARAGEVMRIRPGLHVDGTWGVLAATAAAARISGLGREGCLRALGAAACQMQASLYAPVRAGMTVRNTYAGQAVARGMLLTTAVASGIDAPVDVFADAAAQLGNPAAKAVAAPWHEPGEFLVMQGYFKPYAGVRHTHYAVEAARGWRSSVQGPDTGGITGLVLETYAEAMNYCGIRAPVTPLQAQFSLSYATAHALRHGTLGAEAYGSAALADPETRRLEALVDVQVDPSRVRRGALLRVTTASGERSFDVVQVAGDPTMPFDQAQLRAKALSYLVPAVSPGQAERLADHILDAPAAARFSLSMEEDRK